MDAWLATVESRITELSRAEWLSLAGALALGLLVTLVGRRWIRRRTHRLFAAIDDHVPASVVGWGAPAGRALVWAWTLLAAGATALAAAAILRIDTSGVTGELAAWSSAAGSWLAPKLLRLALLVGVTAMALRFCRRVIPSAVDGYLSRRARRKRRDHDEEEKRIGTLSQLAGTVASWTVLVLAGFVGLSELGFDIGPILAGAGVLGLAIGFGAQNLFRDWFAGVFILLEDQFRIGDVVTVGGISGLVIDINLRRTLLRDLDYAYHTIPNGEIKTASNFTKIVSRTHLDLAVAYKEDIDRCIEILDRVGREMYEERVLAGAMREPLKVQRVQGLADQGVLLKVAGEVEPITQWDVRGEFLHRVKRAFDAEGVELPIPHRRLYVGEGPQGTLPVAAVDQAAATGPRPPGPRGAGAP